MGSYTRHPHWSTLAPLSKAQPKELALALCQTRQIGSSRGNEILGCRLTCIGCKDHGVKELDAHRGSETPGCTLKR